MIGEIRAFGRGDGWRWLRRGAPIEAAWREIQLSIDDSISRIISAGRTRPHVVAR
jgi:hypothetical protein